MLELNGLSKRFGSVEALRGVTLSVGRGEMVGFVGRNGSGKTTTMRIALGLLEADAGTVRFHGAEPTRTDRRRRFGYMPEERGLYPKMPIGDQITYLARLSGLDGKQAAAASERWLDRLGLADRSGDQLEALSLGNQQRVQLAAAVAHGPELLILDEPFSGLDPVGVDVLSESLLELVDSGVGVVFSSHQLELVERLCRSVVIIESGRLVVQGEIDHLRSARAGRAFRVEVDEHRATPVDAGTDSDGWARAVPGVLSVERTDERRRSGLLIRMTEDADEQALLDAARAQGSVRTFATVTPTLAELFREAVSA